MDTRPAPSLTTGPRCEVDDRGWPILRASASEPCDGTNPLTGHPCRLGYHQGYHRDTAGDWWLDD